MNKLLHQVTILKIPTPRRQFRSNNQGLCPALETRMKWRLHCRLASRAAWEGAGSISGLTDWFKRKARGRKARGLGRAKDGKETLVNCKDSKDLMSVSQS